ncbi:MAG: UDP-N-acetylmuramoyl-tripeptide--D-alanyl-D-alanine ligase, partial [Campylobacteraceae bacterium]|nr:UDP-N-acetylmuramoyl-tripeptide--D-alanyl-D-alanine ligase [Campylobacteraceae bacterium]
TKEENEKLAQIADTIFDIIIITGSTNAQVWSESVKRVQKIILKDKSLLTQTLARVTRAGDLILFSNDAPTYM